MSANIPLKQLGKFVVKVSEFETLEKVNGCNRSSLKHRLIYSACSPATDLARQVSHHSFQLS